MWGRACFSIFPLAFTLATLALAVVAFIGSYQLNLGSIYMMNIDLSKVSVDGVSASSVLSGVGVHGYYQVGMNGYCYGSSATDLVACEHPYRPYWFDIVEVLTNSTNTEPIVEKLPKEISSYQQIVRGASYAAWGCIVGVIITCCFSFIFGIFSICSPLMGCCVSIFSGLSFLLSLLAAGITTGLFKVYSSRLESALGTYGLSSEVGNTGISLMWAAVACALLAEVLWILTACCGMCGGSRRRERSLPIENSSMTYDTGYAPVHNHANAGNHGDGKAMYYYEQPQPNSYQPVGRY